MASRRGSASRSKGASTKSKKGVSMVTVPSADLEKDLAACERGREKGVGYLLAELDRLTGATPEAAEAEGNAREVMAIVRFLDDRAEGLRRQLAAVGGKVRDPRSGTKLAGL